MKTVDRIIAEKLLKIRAIILQPANPFTWVSGWNSPHLHRQSQDPLLSGDPQLHQSGALPHDS